MPNELLRPVTITGSRTSHGQVVDEIGMAIVCGEFPVGSVLPGDVELAQRFQVSRTVLREAMKTLAAKGLVVAKARIGTRVTSRQFWNMFDGDVLSWHFECGVSEDFLLSLYEVRLAFEPAAAALAAEKATPQAIARLRHLAEDLGNPDHTVESLAMADLRFHMALADASGNPFMSTLGSLIKAALVGAFKLSSAPVDMGRARDVKTTHLAIVEAIEKRDQPAARAAMEKVILVGRERARSNFATQHK
ncbi:FadR/GntR family transcriptional regulator [Rhizobium terricola]|nr:FadR/GntR family transcriptional regulator [Rhizobium terricola]